MGLFLQKLEKSLRTRAHVVDLPLDSGAVHPLRDQETHVAGGCGLSLSPEQQLLIDVLKQLYKIREEREKAEQHERRSGAAASYGRNVVEFLDEFVKVVAVCQAVLSQRAGEAPAAAAVNRKRKLDSAEWWDQERKEQREDDNGDDEEEGVQIRDMLAHLRKRAKVVVGGGLFCEHHEQARSERSLCCRGGPAEVVGPEQAQEALCVVTLVQQVVTTMTAAADHGRSKRGWLSAALDNGWAGGVHGKRRRTVATTDGCSPPAGGRKRKWAEDGGAASSTRARDTLRRTANMKGHTNDANNTNTNNFNINTNANIAAATNCNNASRQEKRKKLGITIVVTPASCD